MAFYLKLATALCLARAVPSDPFGGCLRRARQSGVERPRRNSVHPVPSFRAEPEVPEAGAGRRRQDLRARGPGRLAEKGHGRCSEAVIDNLIAEETGQYWCFYSGCEPGFDLSLDQRGTGSVLLVVAGPPPSQHSRKFPNGLRGCNAG
ncbi:uncharacterized protein ACO6RY_04651 [Pungitius sinensis]